LSNESFTSKHMDAHSRRPASTKSQRTRLKPSTSAVTWERASTALLLNTPTLLRGQAQPGDALIYTPPRTPLHTHHSTRQPYLSLSTPPCCLSNYLPGAASYLRLLPAPPTCASPPCLPASSRRAFQVAAAAGAGVGSADASARMRMRRASGSCWSRPW